MTGPRMTATEAIASQAKVLLELANSPTLFSDQRPDAELWAVSILHEAGLVTYESLYTGCGQYTLTEAGKAKLLEVMQEAEMVERVAKAVHEHGLPPVMVKQGYRYEESSEQEKELARGYARAAIVAIWESIGATDRELAFTPTAPYAVGDRIITAGDDGAREVGVVKAAALSD